jgi:hypothetical protein
VWCALWLCQIYSASVVTRPYLLVALFAVVLGLSACSSGGSKDASTTATTVRATTTAAGLAVRDRRVCTAFEKFFDTDYAGGTPSAALLARRRDVLAAIQAGHDKALTAAVRSFVDLEMSSPSLSTLKSLPKVEIARLAKASTRDLPIIEVKCDALGRHING